MITPTIIDTKIIVDGSPHDWFYFTDFSNLNDMKTFCETKSQDVDSYSATFDKNNFIVLRTGKTDMLDVMYPLYTYIYGSSTDVIDNVDYIQIYTPLHSDPNTIDYTLTAVTKNLGASFTAWYYWPQMSDYNSLYKSYQVINSLKDAKDYEKCVYYCNVDGIEYCYVTLNNQISIIEIVTNGYFFTYQIHRHDIHNPFDNLFSYDDSVRQAALEDPSSRINGYFDEINTEE